MGLLLIGILSFVPSLIILILLALIIHAAGKDSKIELKHQRIIFLTIGTILTFPIIVPVTIVGIPLPLWGVIFLMAWHGALEAIPQFIILIFHMWKFHLPMVVITFAYVYTFSKFAFFQSPYLQVNTQSIK